MADFKPAELDSISNHNFDDLIVQILENINSKEYNAVLSPFSYLFSNLYAEYIPYYSKYFKTLRDDDCPIFAGFQENTTLLFFPKTQVYNLIWEVAIEAIKTPKIYSDRIQKIYNVYDLIEKAYKKHTESNFKLDYNTILDYAGELNALTGFTTEVDEEMLELVFQSINQSSDLIPEFQEKAELSTIESFDIRWQDNLHKYLKKEKTAREIQWMFSNYYRSVDLSELEKRIESELENFDLKKYTHNRQNNLKIIQDNQKALEDYTQDLSLELQYLAGFIQDSMKIRDTRKDIYGILYTILFNQMNWEFEQRNYPKENIYYACIRDINDGNIDQPDFLEILNKRRFNGVFDFRSKDIVIYNNYRYEEMKIKLLQLNDLKLGLNPDNKTIKGNPASLGIARGKVRIIHSENDFKYFEKGDILVTSMTRPETVPLMKMAAAIVTNEGGITCHAAIVSRELGKPCIVKTKIATEKLKNGDLVEVNADLGIVTILSN